MKNIIVEEAGKRIDQYLNEQDTELTRTLIQKYIADGVIRVNGKENIKSSYKVKVGDEIQIADVEDELTDIMPENIELDIVYEDEDILVVNKPKGMVVHPGNGNYSGTMVNALMYSHKDKLSSIKEVDTTITDETTYNEVTTEKIKENIEFDFSESNKLTILMKENENETIKSTINYTYDNNNLKININSLSNKNGESNNIKMQYEINNYQSDNITQNLLVDMMKNEEETYQVSLINNITLKQDVQISKLTTENSAKLNDMTSEELSQLFTALINRVMTLYGAELMSSNGGLNI